LSKLDDFFDLIKDGTWHSLHELSEKLRIPPEKLADMTKFLSQQGLIQFREEAKMIKIDPKWRSLIYEEEREEVRPTIGTIIIPPTQSLTIQNVEISNETDRAIEFGLSVEKGLMKLAVTRIE